MTRFIILTMQVAALAAFAAGPPLADFCSPFNGKNCEIDWRMTNQLPASVKIWKVVPTKFSQSTVSNLLQMIELTENDKRQPVQEGIFTEKDVLCFGDKSETRYAVFVPSQGFIAVNREGVISIAKETPVNVPTDKEALNAALKLLPTIGVSESELANESDTTPAIRFAVGSQIFRDKPSKKIFTNIVDRTVFLSRKIAGIPVWGTGSISMRFGNEGKLAHLEIIWRAIKPDKDCIVPDAGDFVKRIKSGRAFISKEQADLAIKKLTITKASLYYWENLDSKPQSRIYPFVVLDAKTDFEGENSVVRLFVPFANE